MGEPKSKKETENEMSFENTQAFFGALSFPIDGKNPPRHFGYQKVGPQTYEEWARNWEILGKHLGTDAVLEETGNDYGITRGRTHQIVEKLVNRSSSAAPAPLKEAFPQASLATKKPYSLHKSIRKSEAFGGKMREVVEAVSAGKSNEGIRTETGASSAILAAYRKKGINVPYLKEALGKEYRENLRFLANGLLDDGQILNIFEDIEKHNRYRVCKTLRKAGVLVSLGKSARNVGVFIHTSEPIAYRILKELGMPALHVRHHFTNKTGDQQTLTYFFVLNNHEGTIRAFAQDSFAALRINPVEVLGRVPEEIPTTSIKWDHAYISVGRFLKERGIPISRKKVREYLYPDCKVSVFNIPRGTRSGSRLFVLKEDADALAVYLGTKLHS